MTDTVDIDSRWIAANPVPVHGSGTTKNSRGHVLAVGGSRTVPGALALTGEAALRAGAGKLQMATVASVALAIGLRVPESGVYALDEDKDGELGPATVDPIAQSLEACDVLVLGPGIGARAVAARMTALVAGRLEAPRSLVIDAEAITALRDAGDVLAAYRGRLILTPHHGEMAGLTGIDIDTIAADPVAVACEVAERFGAVVVLKGSETVVASPDASTLRYHGGGIGLATAGSGDVLAGAIAGLLSRGTPPVVAAGWGVWLHGQAGRRAATLRGPIGFLARELASEFPYLLPQ